MASGETARSYGVDPDLDLRRSMSDFYVLERLAADGSVRAAKELRRLEGELSPVFASYLTMIVGGELRHLPRMVSSSEDCEGGEADYESDCDCCGSPYDHPGHAYPKPSYFDGDGWENGVCNACPTCKSPVCGVCGESSEDCQSDDDCGSFEYGWATCDCQTSCDLHCTHGPYDGHSGLNVGELGNYCGCYCPTRYLDCGDSHDDGDWQEGTDERLCDWIADGADSSSGGRSAAWKLWRGFCNEVGTVKALRMAADSFGNGAWQGGYGGKSWQTIARLAADYLDGKVKPRTFVDRCWSLQHNSGAMFDKVWGREVCADLQRLLVKQAADDYSALTVYIRPDIRPMWRMRNAFVKDYADRDPGWLGTEVYANERAEVEW